MDWGLLQQFIDADRRLSEMEQREIDRASGNASGGAINANNLGSMLQSRGYG